jgi:MFS family permease
MGTIVGGLVFGYLMDQPSLRRRFKLVLLSLSFTSCVFFLWFIFSLPSLIDHSPVLPSSLTILGVSITLGGIALGGAQPLYYELAAELTYPVPEVISASFITLFNNVGDSHLLLYPVLVVTTLYCWGWCCNNR